MTQDSLPVRRAGRVIVLDPQDRVLLFRYDDDPPNGRHWSTPGGGLNPGESYADGALRELVEETGWSDVPLGDLVYEHEIIMEYGPRLVRQHECLFLARVAVPGREVADVAGMHASDGIAAWRWWTLPAIEAATGAGTEAGTEMIWPQGLAGLIAGVL
jgi:ADP-ribose pyrophosphatase YjhB (NUDIX family)